MPSFPAGDKEVEFGPLVEAQSDSDLDSSGRTQVPRAAGKRTARCIIGAVLLPVLVFAVGFGRASIHKDEADTQEVISESHFSQSCSWKCNRKFWGKGHVAQSAQEEYQKCCQECPGSACTFPCTDSCRQKREKKGKTCSADANCMDGVEKEHTECCSSCPGSVCVTEESEEIGKVAVSAGASAGGELGAESIESGAVAKTCNGDAGGAPCQFPFTWHGLQYASCTMVDSDLANDQAWCYTTTAGKWGNCKCPSS